MKTTKPEAAAIDSASETATAPRRTLRDRLAAYLWRNRAYVAGLTNGVIFGVSVCVIAVAFLGLK